MFLGAGSVMHGMHDEHGHEADGRALPRRDAALRRDVHRSARWRWLACTRRSGFFAQGRHPRGGEQHRATGCSSLGAVGASLRALHRAAGVPHVLRPCTSEEAEHAHESPAVMTIPLVLLALGAGVASLLDLTIRRRSRRSWSRWSGRRPRARPALVRCDRRHLVARWSRIGLFTTWFVYGSGKIDWLALRVRDAARPARRSNTGGTSTHYYSALLVTPGRRRRVAPRTSSTPGSSTASSTDRSGRPALARERTAAADRVWSARTRSRSWPARSASSSTWGSGCDRSPAHDRDVPPRSSAAVALVVRRGAPDNSASLARDAHRGGHVRRLAGRSSASSTVPTPGSSWWSGPRG